MHSTHGLECLGLVGRSFATALDGMAQYACAEDTDHLGLGQSMEEEGQLDYDWRDVAEDHSAALPGLAAGHNK